MSLISPRDFAASPMGRKLLIRSFIVSVTCFASKMHSAFSMIDPAGLGDLYPASANGIGY